MTSVSAGYSITTTHSALQNKNNTLQIDVTFDIMFLFLKTLAILVGKNSIGSC